MDKRSITFKTINLTEESSAEALKSSNKRATYRIQSVNLLSDSRHTIQRIISSEFGMGNTIWEESALSLLGLFSVKILTEDLSSTRTCIEAN